jgi:hypothetical protein
VPVVLGEINIAETLIPDRSLLDVDISIVKLERHKSSVIDYISENLIQAEFKTLRYEIHKLVSSVWYKEELPDNFNEYIAINIY